MNKLRQSHLEKKPQNTESKPEKLAKIMYGAIMRYIKAKNARNVEKNIGLALDSSRERRVNVTCDDVD